MDIKTDMFAFINENANQAKYNRERAQRQARFEKRRKKENLKKIIVSILVAIVSFGILTTGVLASPHIEDKNNNANQIESNSRLQNKFNSDMNELINNYEDPIEVVEEIEEPHYTFSKYNASADEIWWFEQIVAAEVYLYWTEEEMLYISSAIMNRIESNKFPDDIISVLTEKTQFSTYSDGRYLEVVPNEKVEGAVERALNGETNVPEYILYFCTRDYYESASEDDFFKKDLINVPEYNFRNIMMFREK